MLGQPCAWWHSNHPHENPNKNHLITPVQVQAAPDQKQPERMWQPGHALPLACGDQPGNQSRVTAKLTREHCFLHCPTYRKTFEDTEKHCQIFVWVGQKLVLDASVFQWTRKNVLKCDMGQVGSLTSLTLKACVHTTNLHASQACFCQVS